MANSINQTLYSFTISASGIIVGTVVGSLTYTTIKTVSTTLCFFTSKGTFLLSLILGYSTDYLFGSRIGYIVSESINHCSDLFLIKPIDSISNKTATISSIITGSLASLTTCVILSSSSYIISKASNYYFVSSNNSPSLKCIEENEYTIIET